MENSIFCAVYICAVLASQLVVDIFLKLNSLVCRVSGRSSILLEMQIMLIKYKKFSLC